MNILFIQSFLNKDYEMLKFKLAIVGIMWCIVGVAIVVDLISGYRKAKERGEARNSYGLRRTVNKSVLYYSFMIIGFLFDCIITFYYSLPIVTFVCTGYLLYIEGRSVFEKAKDKDKKRMHQGAKELLYILEHRHDLKRVLDDMNELHETKNTKNIDYEADQMD